MIVGLDESCSVAALEEVPVATSPAVEVLRVHPVQLPHRVG